MGFSPLYLISLLLLMSSPAFQWGLLCMGDSCPGPSQGASLLSGVMTYSGCIFSIFYFRPRVGHFSRESWFFFCGKWPLEVTVLAWRCSLLLYFIYCFWIFSLERARIPRYAHIHTFKDKLCPECTLTIPMQIQNCRDFNLLYLTSLSFFNYVFRRVVYFKAY